MLVLILHTELVTVSKKNDIVNDHLAYRKTYVLNFISKKPLVLYYPGNAVLKSALEGLALALLVLVYRNKHLVAVAKHVVDAALYLMLYLGKI